MFDILNCRYILPMIGNTVKKYHSIVIKDGIIVDILPCSEGKKKYPISQERFLFNYIVMPGFVNAHNHSPMIFFRGIIPEGTPLDEVLHKYMFPLEEKFASNPGFVYKAAKAAAIEMLNAGTTTTAEMYYHAESIMQAYKEVGIRAVIGETVMSSRETPSAKNPLESIKIAENAMKLQDDLLEVAIAPHATYTVDDKIMKLCHDACKSFGLKMLMHSNESRFELEEILKRPGNEERDWPITYLSKLGVFDDIKTTLAHCCYLNMKEIENILEHDIGIALNPVSNALCGNKTANLKLMIKYLIRAGLATDGPMTNDSIDLLSQLKPALTAYLNSEPGTWLDSYKIVELATIGSAKALHLDHKIGTIEIGKEADLIVFEINERAKQYLNNDNIFQYIVRCSKPEDIVLRMVKGKEIPKRYESGFQDLEKFK